MILVTGGAGFIGSNFIHGWLADRTAGVINFDKLTYAGNRGNLRSVEADPRALSSSLGLLFLAFCQGAQQKVWVRVGRQDAQAECVLERDGYAVPPEQLAWLAEWFATTQNALFGLGLALVQRVVQAAQSGAKFAGFGGVCEPELIRKYVDLGMRMILAGNDVGLLFAAAKERAAFVRGCVT